MKRLIFVILLWGIAIWAAIHFMPPSFEVVAPYFAAGEIALWLMSQVVR